MWKSRAGSVSIALILLIAPLVTFHATLIDAARVQIAERETERAVKAALRSVLSAYDQELQSYGLYGLGIREEEGAALFRHVIETNLENSKNGLRLIAPASAGGSIKTLHTLANHGVFERQVMEEMKYRAPIEFTFGLVDKLRKESNAASILLGTSQLTRIARQIEEAMEKRDRLLDEAWSGVQELAHRLSAMKSYYAGKLYELYDLSEQIGLRNADELRSSIVSLRQQAQQLQTTIMHHRTTLSGLLGDAQQAMQQIMHIQMTIASLEQNAASLYARIGEAERVLELIARYTVLMNATKWEAKRDQAVVAEYTEWIMSKLDEAKSYDAEIQRISGEPTDPASGISAEARNAAVLPDVYYIQFKTGAGGMGALYNGFVTSLDATSSFIGEMRLDSERIAVLSASNEAYEQRAAQFIREQRRLEDNRRTNKDGAARRKKQEESRLDQILDQLRTVQIQCSANDSRHYTWLVRGDEAAKPSLYRKYMEYNRQEAVPAINVPELGGAAGMMDSAAGLIDRLLDGLQNAAIQLRDELYTNEFALTKFNYRTYGMETGPDGQAKPDYERSGRDSHALQGQEAEYLLYGLDSCMKNLSAAYAEMFTLRLAIRAGEALASPDQGVVSMGSPLLTIAWALAEGAAAAYADMTRLTAGEEVAVTAKLSDRITMSYKDYLRLFMLLHTKKEPMMARMQSLIELNTGRDLRQTGAFLQASAETNIKLWFMPYTMAAFGTSVEGRQAVIRKSAVLSY